MEVHRIKSTSTATRSQKEFPKHEDDSGIERKQPALKLLESQEKRKKAYRKGGNKHHSKFAARRVEKLRKEKKLEPSTCYYDRRRKGDVGNAL